MGSVNACSRPPSSATRSSATAYQRLHVAPSSLVRRSTCTSPRRAGGAQITPAMVKRMPASRTGALTPAAALSSGAAVAPASAPREPSSPAAAGSTGRDAGRLVVRSTTGGVLIQASTASLTRGAAQTAATAPRTERMEIAARRAARLWGRGRAMSSSG